MVTFLSGVVLLVVGYLLYGWFIERVLRINPRRLTPAYTRGDGVDFVPMATWRVFLIQFLNIAGLGPIFGAVMGAKFGTSAYLWIVFGTIFAGAVHDMTAGVLSMRSGGASLPELIGRYLGRGTKQFVRIFSILLMVLVGAVFIAGPAGLLDNLTPDMEDYLFWVYLIFGYYFLATMLPIDKLIGRIYPLFAAALLFMAVAMAVVLVVKWPALPELTDGLRNTHPQGLPIFPMMFISIACGAISGFHATQSPLMARCMKNERHARPVFYGAMVAEGVVALIWCAVATWFFHTPQGSALFASSNENAAVVVDWVTRDWLGVSGAVLAMVGVVVAPITSGDTALRSARLMAADMLRFDQRSIGRRLALSVPLFLATFLVLQLEFGVVWRYFAWANQTLSVFTLWAVSVWFARTRPKYCWVAVAPALFMTAVCSTYLLMADSGFGINQTISYIWGSVAAVAAMVVFLITQKKYILR